MFMTIVQMCMFNIGCPVHLNRIASVHRMSQLGVTLPRPGDTRSLRMETDHLYMTDSG